MLGYVQTLPRDNAACRIGNTAKHALAISMRERGGGEAVTFEAKERENEIFRGESKSCDTFCYDLLLDSIIRETLIDTKWIYKKCLRPRFPKFSIFNVYLMLFIIILKFLRSHVQREREKG